MSNGLTGRSLRLLSLALLSLVLLVVVAGLSLTHRGAAEMEKSNEAFHGGRLRDAVHHARRAALSYVPGATHVQQAHERLEAIARGAETAGDRQIARVAWDTLRLVHVQTDYPGRPPSAAEARANAALKRMNTARPSVH